MLRAKVHSVFARMAATDEVVALFRWVSDSGIGCSPPVRASPTHQELMSLSPGKCGPHQLSPERVAADSSATVVKKMCFDASAYASAHLLQAAVSSSSLAIKPDDCLSSPDSDASTHFEDQTSQARPLPCELVACRHFDLKLQLDAREVHPCLYHDARSSPTGVAALCPLSKRRRPWPCPPWWGSSSQPAAPRSM